MNQIKNVAIGFVTGRKNFKNVLRTYAFRWKDVISQSALNIHLIVAYDLSYNNTQIEDYIVLQKKVRDVFSSVTFLGPEKLMNTYKWQLERAF